MGFSRYNYYAYHCVGRHNPLELIDRVRTSHPISHVVFCATVDRVGAEKTYLYRGTLEQDYITFCEERLYCQSNPLVTQLNRSVRPLGWQDLRKASPRGASFVNESAEFRVGPHAITIPVHSPDGVSSWTSFTSDLSRSDWVDFTRRATGELVLVGQLLHSQLTAEIGQKQMPDYQIKPLSNTEEQCLRLQSEGVTMEGIGELLGISACTVRTHLVSCRNKLVASTTAEAIAKMYRYRLW